ARGSAQPAPASPAARSVAGLAPGVSGSSKRMNAKEPKPRSQRHDRWTNRKAFTVTHETYAAFNRVKKSFNCKLCGHVFAVGDTARWIYCNSTPGMQTGNFFVCGNCDGTDADVQARAKTDLRFAVTLAKKWGIYGPDW